MQLIIAKVVKAKDLKKYKLSDVVRVDWFDFYRDKMSLTEEVN